MSHLGVPKHITLVLLLLLPKANSSKPLATALFLFDQEHTFKSEPPYHTSSHTHSPPALHRTGLSQTGKLATPWVSSLETEVETALLTPHGTSPSNTCPGSSSFPSQLLRSPDLRLQRKPEGQCRHSHFHWHRHITLGHSLLVARRLVAAFSPFH